MGIIRRVFSSLLFLLISLVVYPQTNRISGIVRDSINGEKLVGAYVVCADHSSGTITNNEGFFSLSVASNTSYLSVSYIGYSTKKIQVKPGIDSTLTIDLSANISIGEVLVVGDKTDLTRFRAFAITQIPVKLIKQTPAMLGEVDVLKTIQLLPGVSPTWAGFSSMIVRGGNPDQNLLLIDDIPLYTYSHFYGMFSVISENALQSVRFFKGALPARYGGRLSSVVDITMKDGNIRNHEGEFSLGFMSGSFALNGPFKNNKTTYSFTVRRSLYDFFLLPYNLIANKPRSGYYFGDISGKITHRISDKDKLTFSVFASRDKFYDITKTVEYNQNGVTGQFKRDNGYHWQNYISSVKWNRIINPSLTVNNSAYYSNFSLERHTADQLTEQGITYRSEVSFMSSINDIGLRSDWQYYPTSNNRLYFGVNFTLHLFKPGVSLFYDKNIETGETVSSTYGNEPVELLETSAYFEYDARLFEFLTFNLGLRLTDLNSKGTNLIIPDPRVSATIKLIPGSTLTIFYLKTNQCFHLLRSSVLELPSDLWVPASKEFPAEKATQYGIEASYQLNNSYEISTACFYKSMQNLIEYKEGSSIYSTKDGWEEKVELGSGTAYGAEFLFQKKTGKLNGWVAYTLSWSKRQFDNINNGEEFYSSFDKRHEVSVTSSYELDKNWKFGATWIFSTGTPYSIPEYFQDIINIKSHNGISGNLTSIPDGQFYETKNSLRLPTYNRLDLGVTYSRPVRKHPERERSLSASIYNVYNRKNSYYRGVISGTVYDASLFGILPSLTYRLKF